MRIPHVLTLILLFVAAMVGSAHGRTFVVYSPLDRHDLIAGDGKCGDPNLPDSITATLRAAIEEVNAGSGGDTVLFDSTLRTIYLSLGELHLTAKRISVTGNGSAVVLDGVHNPFFASTLVLLSDSNRIVGITFQRSRYHAVEIRGRGNQVGDSTGGVGTVFLANGLDNGSDGAIYVTGVGATDNSISGCLIGLSAHGESYPNRVGIFLDSFCSGNLVGAGTVIGQNVITNNGGFGIKIGHRSFSNRISGNVVGTDASILMGQGNSAGGIGLESGAHSNTVGPINWISRNRGPGISLSGSGTTNNLLIGNWVGLDNTGEIGIGNAVGVLIADGASNNQIGNGSDSGRNAITGNDGDGIRIVGPGTRDNRILGNFVGTDTSGYYDLGNGFTGGAGIFIGGQASHTIVGSEVQGCANVISGNPGAGIRIDGSSGNIVSGNIIGVSIGSVSSCPNGNGVQLLGGATDNVIGGTIAGSGNVISGNRADIFPNGTGVAILGNGTSHNRVIGNMIGTDIFGSRAMRNGSAGVLIGDGAHDNQIGGADFAERNVISGNGVGSLSAGLGAGVHLFGEGTSHNQIQGNYIGVAANGVDKILNLGNGIGVYGGADDNLIGGDAAGEGNVIARNPLFGVYVVDAGSTGNSILGNAIFGNDSMGIKVRTAGIPSPPVLALVSSPAATGTALPGSRVQIFKAAPDKSGRGQGKLLVGDDHADSSGYFSIAVTGIVSGDTVTATQTDSGGSTSEFAINAIVDAPTDIVTKEELPFTFQLGQNYPNPFNPATSIEFSLPHSTRVRLIVINSLGQEVTTLVDGVAAAGWHIARWSGTDRTHSPVASGVYYYRLTGAGATITRKMILLK
ncbi:MAG: T9SS type A sorting domain-containing protein [Candidatus Zixiibacteriota bacterium]